MQSTNDAIIDLTWYWQFACADLGIRSSQAKFEEALRLGYFPHGGGTGTLLESERVVQAGTRLRAIEDRLMLLSAEERITIALAFSTPVRLGAYAVTLLADTEAAKSALRAQRMRPSKWAPRGVDFTGLKFRTGDQFASTNVREFCAWIFARKAKDKTAGRVWMDITAEAGRKQTSAVEAFRRAEVPKPAKPSRFQQAVSEHGLDAAIGMLRRGEV